MGRRCGPSAPNGGIERRARIGQAMIDK